MIFETTVIVLLILILVLVLAVLVIAIRIGRNYCKIQEDTRETLHRLCDVLVVFQGFVNLTKMSEELIAKTAVKLGKTATEIKDAITKAG